MGHQALELFGHAFEYHDAIGELGVLTAERPAGQREYTGIVGRFDQELDEVSADQAAGAGHQRDFCCSAHGAKLNKFHGCDSSAFASHLPVVTRSGDAAVPRRNKLARGEWSPRISTVTRRSTCMFLAITGNTCASAGANP